MRKRQYAVILTGTALASAVATNAAQAGPQSWNFNGPIGGGGSKHGPTGSYAGWVNDYATGGGAYELGFCSTQSGACDFDSFQANGTLQTGGSTTLPHHNSVIPYAINETGHTQDHSIYAPSN